MHSPIVNASDRDNSKDEHQQLTSGEMKKKWRDRKEGQKE
jgi:hypothetical protein